MCHRYVDNLIDASLCTICIGGQKKAINAVAKKRRKAGGAAVKKASTKPVTSAIKDHNHGNF